jgi:hypothetical protein
MEGEADPITPCKRLDLVDPERIETDEAADLVFDDRGLTLRVGNLGEKTFSARRFVIVGPDLEISRLISEAEAE